MDKTYREWMKEVNSSLSAVFGIDSNDLVDFPSRDCYEEEYTIHEGAVACLDEQENEEMIQLYCEHHKIEDPR